MRARFSSLFFVLPLMVFKITSIQAAPDFSSLIVNSFMFGNFFGSDNRNLVDVKQSPYRWIGRLNAPDGEWCTASLVGPNLIITASHCVVRKGRLVTGKYYFKRGYQNGTALDGAEATVIHYGSAHPDQTPEDRIYDFAFLTLERSLGQKNEFFDYLAEAKQADMTRGISVAGYGQLSGRGEKLTAQRGCQIREYDGALFYHDCDFSLGDSGAPLFVCESGSQCKLIGLGVAEYRDGAKMSLKLPQYDSDHTNIGLNVRMFADQIVRLRK